MIRIVLLAPFEELKEQAEEVLPRGWKPDARGMGGNMISARF